MHHILLTQWTPMSNVDESQEKNVEEEAVTLLKIPNIGSQLTKLKKQTDPLQLGIKTGGTSVGVKGCNQEEG